MNSGFPVAQSAQELLTEARKISGLDIVDTAAAEPLAIIIDSYNGESLLSQAGAREMRKWLLRYLVNRLRMQRDFAAHPEITEIRLKAPVLITCIPRTGSTKLHKTLAATGDFNVTPLWMVLNPSSVTGVPNESVDGRVADGEDFTQYINQASPAARAVHEVETHEPEEDAFIMGHSLISPMINAFAHCPSYLAWYAKQDHSCQYQYDRRVLQYLIWQGLADVDKPFILKSAFNSGLESCVLAGFPDAHLVVPHRNPTESVPSSCKLLSEVYRGAFSDHKFDVSMVPKAQARMKAKEISFRKAHPQQRFLDTSYTKLIKDPLTVIHQVYDFAGLRLSDAALGRIAHWEAQNPKGKHGANSYSMEEFGFTGEQINELFADYRRDYAVYF